MATAETGDVDEAVGMILARVRAEEAIVDRILGLPKGSVELSGSPQFLKTVIVAWNELPAA